MLAPDSHARPTRAYVSFRLPGIHQIYRAVIDTGSEANVVGMKFIEEANLARYMRPYYSELFPIGGNLIPCSFKLSIPIRFRDDPTSYLVDFLVLNDCPHIILGQPWLRSMELCMDLGFSDPLKFVLKSSSESKLPQRFVTDIELESQELADAHSVSRTFTRYSVPFIDLLFHKSLPLESALLDSGAMVNIISLHKFHQIAPLMKQQLLPSSHKTLTGAGSEVSVVGEADLQIIIQLYVTNPSTSDAACSKELTLTERFLVTEDPGEPITLGLPFLANKPWLVDLVSRAIYTKNGYHLKLRYPRDVNTHGPLKQLDRTDSFKTYLTSLNHTAQLRDITPLTQLADECTAVSAYYTKLLPHMIQNPMLILFDPQHGAQGYELRMAQRWLRDHPSLATDYFGCHHTHKLFAKSQPQTCAANHSPILVLDDNYYRVTEGYRKGTQYDDKLRLWMSLISALQRPFATTIRRSKAHSELPSPDINTPETSSNPSLQHQSLNSQQHRANVMNNCDGPHICNQASLPVPHTKDELFTFTDQPRYSNNGKIPDPVPISPYRPWSQADQPNLPTIPHSSLSSGFDCAEPDQSATSILPTKPIHHSLGEQYIPHTTSTPVTDHEIPNMITPHELEEFGKHTTYSSITTEGNLQVHTHVSPPELREFSRHVAETPFTMAETVNQELNTGQSHLHDSPTTIPKQCDSISAPPDSQPSAGKVDNAQSEHYQAVSSADNDSIFQQRSQSHSLSDTTLHMLDVDKPTVMPRTYRKPQPSPVTACNFDTLAPQQIITRHNPQQVDPVSSIIQSRPNQIQIDVPAQMSTELSTVSSKKVTFSEPLIDDSIPTLPTQLTHQLDHQQAVRPKTTSISKKVTFSEPLIDDSTPSPLQQFTYQLDHQQAVRPKSTHIQDEHFLAL